MRELNIIVACDLENGIGKNTDIPWKLPEDMAYFRETTSKPEYNNVVIMGRKTYYSIPRKFRPLSGRINIVMSRDITNDSNYSDSDKEALEKGNLIVVDSFESAMKEVETGNTKVWVIGGGQVYDTAINFWLNNSAEYTRLEIYRTRIYHKFECDTFFPDLGKLPMKLTHMLSMKKQKSVKSELEYNFEVLEYSAANTHKN